MSALSYDAQRALLLMALPAERRNGITYWSAAIRADLPADGRAIAGKLRSLKAEGLVDHSPAWFSGGGVYWHLTKAGAREAARLRALQELERAGGAKLVRRAEAISA